jgi:hypothetical protein
MDDVAKAIKELLPRSAGISLFLDGDFSGKSPAGLGVDPISLARTPSGECTRIDINANDELTGILKLFLGSLVRLDELFPGFREFIGVFEDREEGVVIFLPTPRESNGD